MSQTPTPPATRTLRIANRPVSLIGQGTWYLGDNPAHRDEEIAALRRGVELGLTLIDTAEMYGSGRSESLVGEAIAPIRNNVTLVSKVLPSNASRHGTRKACEASLKRLGVERLDLYLLHWPGNHPLAETISAFEELFHAGKIRAWGVSNFDVRLMEELFAFPHGDMCATNQILYNPEYRGVEFDLLPLCQRHKLPVMAYSPVGQGGELLASPALQTIAARHAATPAQVALAWALRQPGLCAIPKAGTVAHVEENAAALNLQLTPEDLADLEDAYPPPTRREPLATL